VKGADWMSIISPEAATPERVRAAVTGKVRAAWNEEHNPSSTTPSVDPDPIGPNTYYRLIKDGPARSVTIKVNVPGPVSPTTMESLRRAAADAVKASDYSSGLPNLVVDVVVAGAPSTPTPTPGSTGH
jgi:hypothetical protein